MVKYIVVGTAPSGTRTYLTEVNQSLNLRMFYWQTDPSMSVRFGARKTAARWAKVHGGEVREVRVKA